MFSNRLLVDVGGGDFSDVKHKCTFGLIPYQF